ncbi:MAG: hypothetical protein LBJ39_05865 [Tannerellaceae bacterium]|jgi:hypothetical protein|nr:hypothetical protein [Tannerellaceae bacterium]
MKFKSVLIYMLLGGALFATSCDKKDDPEPVTGRTVLVYMAADNNLSNFSYENIRDMIKGAEGDYLNNGKLLIYQDSGSNPPRLINIRKGLNGQMEEELIREYENRNSVDVEVMRSVFNEVFNNELYKSDSYGLILWSHGTAWLPSDVKNYLRSYGQDGSNHMEINDLKEAMRGFRFDFIIFDDCYMANIEVACALQDNADYILASPTEVLAPGLPYQHIVKYMFESGGNIQRSMNKIGNTFYSYYNEQLAGANYPKSASTTLVKTAGIDALANISRQIVAGKEETILNLSIDNIQQLEYLRPSTYHALYDFSDFIRQLATPEEYAAFQTALRDVVVYYETTDIAYYNYGGDGITVTIDRPRYCGITSYVPQKDLASLNEWYKILDWYKLVYE